MSNGMGPATTSIGQLKLKELGPLSTVQLRAEDKHRRLKGVHTRGQSASAAVTYDMWPDLTGISKMQLGRSSHYTRSTVSQGLMVRAGFRQEWVLAGEIGRIEFQDFSRMTLARFGPTWRWSGIQPGQVSYRYSRGRSTAHSGHLFDVQINLNESLKVGVLHQRGRGAYDLLTPGHTPIDAHVRHHLTEVRVVRDLSTGLAIHLKAGESYVEDLETRSRDHRSTDWGVGLSVRW